MMCCAACGIAEVDDVKLKDCSACKLVKYCGVKCQKDHRPQHKKECKMRAAELRDELLFKQPMREINESLPHKCPFCRHPVPKSEEEFKRNLMERVEANDPFALHQMGLYRNQERDYENAFPYFTKATGMGDIQSHYDLSCLYREGLGVKKDKEKELHHLEEAVIGGHPYARHNLGCVELTNCRTDRAIKHWIIAANLGFENSLVPLTNAYRKGLVSKKDLAAALRAHQAAVNATKSPKRDEAAADRHAKAARQN
eukprot:scaffold10530_cov140-Skeletonema_marinoi.AAC.6